MATINLENGEKEVLFSVETLTIYEQEFGGADLIHDLYRPVGVSKEEMKEQAADVVISFRMINWVALVKVLWAGIKTADPTTPSFKVWNKTVGNINLAKIHTALDPLINAAFFWEGDATSD